MKQRRPEKIVRDIIDLCSGCDSCRPLMDQDCAFFPELYRLWDREHEQGIAITGDELRDLVDLCTFCGVCPCSNIPSDLMDAKSRYVGEEGLSLRERLSNDVPRLARVCGTFPLLFQILESSPRLGKLMKQVAGVHPERRLPFFAREDFFRWAKKKGLATRKEQDVTYFVGCTAGYLFPEIGKAVVKVLERNGLTVHVPSQGCCGMPYVAEGDRSNALKQVESNFSVLLDSAPDGKDVICSCPTCGFFMKVLLKENACFSEQYQTLLGAREDEIRIPGSYGRGEKFKSVRKANYGMLLKDDGYFSSLDPMRRMELAERTSDAGEYLARLHNQKRLKIEFGAIRKRVLYFAPCHQRVQNIGSPYLGLLGLIPGLTVESLPGMGCCGMGGNFGFKSGFLESSLAVGEPLMARIRDRDPEAIVTDCLSCRLQFSHTLPYQVFHPMELIAMAYAVGEPGVAESGASL